MSTEPRETQNIIPLALGFFVLLALVIFIALPNLFGVQALAKRAQLRANMVIIQNAADEYASKKNGKYPKSVVELAPFLPGGSKIVGGGSGQWPENPYSGELGSCVDGIPFLIMGYGEEMKPGLVVYFSSENEYAIVGTGPDKERIFTPGLGGRPLVLSRP